MRATATLITFVTWTNVHAFPQYRIEFLRDIDGTEIRGMKTNERGDYVGFRPNFGGIVAFVNGQRHFVTETGSVGFEIADINENGVLAGNTDDGRMFTWSVETGLVELPHPTSGFGQYEISGINDDGTVVGVWASDDRSYILASFTITPDRQITLHNSGFLARDINNAGRAVGTAGFQQGFYRDIGGVEQLTAQYGTSSRPNVIDNDGTMYGWGTPLFANGQNAVLRYRTPNTVEELFRGDLFGSVPVSSGAGELAITIRPPGGLPTLNLWSEESGLVDISDLLDEESRALNLVPWIPRDMNASGMITALVRPSDQSAGFRTAILTPVPEPGTMLALGAGLAALLRRKRAT